MPGAELRLELQPDHVLRVSGPLDIDTVPELLARNHDPFGDAAPAIVDLGGVVRSDSAGLALLVEWVRQARRAGRDLRFVNVPEQMRHIASVSRLERILPLDDARP